MIEVQLSTTLDTGCCRCGCHVGELKNVVRNLARDIIAVKLPSNHLQVKEGMRIIKSIDFM
jgi:hypothetical protein